jgi:formate hydrogenlyase subunit 4
MSAAAIASAAVELVGGFALAPLLPGSIQRAKARLEGRLGPSPLQPYRELRRLWSKSAVDVEGAGLVYRLAPSAAAACAALAMLIVPVTGAAAGLGVGHDLFALIAILALARAALALAAWDTGNGFSLMGASRDLTIAVSVEAAAVLSLAVPALVAGTTNLADMSARTAGTGVWSTPALGLAAVGFALVVVAETGRQPIDNPDTHLELTMIHEGPLLEYAGRDLALLQWAAAVRHWIVLVIVAAVFLPHPHDAWAQLALLPAALAAVCAALAVTEILTAKLRILVAPRVLALGAVAGLFGVVSWLAQ